MVKAAIFDMDGLLIDSEPLWQRAEMECFSSVGLDLTVEMCRETMGMLTSEMVSYWYRKYPWEKVTKDEMRNQVVNRMIELLKSEAQPMDGVLNAVMQLKDAGLDMMIASSSPQVIIDAVIDSLDLRQHIPFGISAESQDFGKPHPAVFIHAARILGVDPYDCLAFEDSINGVISAKAARMITVVVPDAEMYDRTEFSIADIKLRSLTDFNLSSIMESTN